MPSFASSSDPHLPGPPAPPSAGAGVPAGAALIPAQLIRRVGLRREGSVRLLMYLFTLLRYK